MTLTDLHRKWPAFIADLKNGQILSADGKRVLLTAEELKALK